MKPAVLCFLLLFPLYSSAKCWNSERILQQTLYSTLSYIDYKQTQYAIHDYPKMYPNSNIRYIEANPIVGTNSPSNSRLRNITLLGNLSFASSVWLDCRYSNQRNHDNLRWAAVGFRLGVVVHNDSIGLKFHIVL